MTVRIEISPAERDQLTVRAAAEGLSLPAYLGRIVTVALPKRWPVVRALIVSSEIIAGPEANRGTEHRAGDARSRSIDGQRKGERAPL